VTGTFTLAARGPFSLATSTRFLEGFTPAAYTGAAGQPLEMAFPVEGTWQATGVRVREYPGGFSRLYPGGLFDLPPPGGPGVHAAVIDHAWQRRIILFT
jgi:hypothetical protein